MINQESSQLTEERYFLDLRSGCAAVRDRQHKRYDPDYEGLHQETVDVVEFRMGFINNEKRSWDMKAEDVEYLTNLCNELNQNEVKVIKDLTQEQAKSIVLDSYYTEDNNDIKVAVKVNEKINGFIYTDEYQLVFERDGKFYRFFYLTNKEEIDWSHMNDIHIKLEQVFPKEIITIVYE